MKFDLYSIYDSKADVHSRPLVALNLPTFERELQRAVSDSNSPYSKHSADFTLFLLGSYNDHNAQFEILPSKIALYNLAEFRSRVYAAAAALAPEVSDV